MLKRVVCFSFGILFFSLACSAEVVPATKSAGVVYRINTVLAAPYAGPITPVAAEYLNNAIDKAEAEKFNLLVIQLDTPGGLDGAMREIIKKILASKVPVALFVSPQGARAASAGVFMAMASNLVVMAPGTNMGAAHPVMLGSMSSMSRDKNEKKKDPMADKVLNDSAAYMQSITQKSGRNVAWAVRAVTQSASIPAEEAVKIGAADLMAADLPELLVKINGRELPGYGKLSLDKPLISYFNQTKRQKMLAVISDPNIAMILMSLGAAGLFIELYNPGLILPGVVGALSLVLGFYSFQSLSANFAGVLLILLGFICFVAEIKVLSYGLLTVGGVISFVLGALLLFNNPSMGGLAISMKILGSTVFGMVCVTALLAWIVLRAQMRKIVTGIESLAGKQGLAKTALNPGGTVLVEGELWAAESLSGEIMQGAAVRVEAVNGFKVTVTKLLQ